MKKILFTALLAMVSIAMVHGQGIGKLNKSANKKTSVTEQKIGNEPAGMPTADPSTNKFNTSSLQRLDDNVQVKADSAFYQKVVKRNGWYVGVGPKLTAEQASHLDLYYKLSNKSAAGNWTLLQAFDGYGRHNTQHKNRNYLISVYDTDDTSYNADWKAKINSVCQWTLIPSYDGKMCIQEQGLDSDGNIVYAMVWTKIGAHNYYCAYIDVWGRPAYMRTDSVGNDVGQANFVEVVLNDDGYESLLKYYDRNGTPAKSRSGAYMLRKETDAAGNVLCVTALDFFGQPMNDDWNSAIEINTYDKDGRKLTVLNYDADGQPALSINGSYGDCYEYDSYGRFKSLTKLDASGHKCNGSDGICQVASEYNNHGAVTRLVLYDESGKKYKGTYSAAEVVYSYNEDGDTTLIESYDADGRLVNNAGYCRRTMDYKNGRKTAEHKFVSRDSLVVETYRYETDDKGNTRQTWFDDNHVCMESFNNQGKLTSRRFYHLDMTPKDNWGYHRMDYQYAVKDHKLTTMAQWTDKDGQPAYMLNGDGNANKYSRNVTVLDSLTRTYTNYQYAGDKLFKAQRFDYDDGWLHSETMCNLTHYGAHARTGNAFYYKVAFGHDATGRQTSMMGVNEFGEPAYVTSGDSRTVVFLYSDESSGEDIDYDEFHNIVTYQQLDSLARVLPKAYCIEVTDTLKAYNLDIHNNDIVMGYGDWAVCEDVWSGTEGFVQELQTQSNRHKTMTIMRHFPDQKQSKIITVNLGNGKPEDFGFTTHLIFYTQREKLRLINTAGAAGFKLAPRQ